MRAQPAHNSIEVKYLVLGDSHAFDDGIMDWETVLRSADGQYGWDNLGFRVIEVAVTRRPGFSPRFTWGRDITEEASAKAAVYERTDDFPVAPDASRLISSAEAENRPVKGEAA